LAERDQPHHVCVEALKSLRPPLFTTWAVLAEATYLLRRQPDAIHALFRLLHDGVLVIPPLDATIAPWLAAFFQQYRDQEPQLADATLVYLAEQLQVNTVFTLDRRHFTTYRLSGGRAFTLIPEQL
jgi:predicted nucleic acid-binding protein